MAYQGTAHYQDLVHLRSQLERATRQRNERRAEAERLHAQIVTLGEQVIAKDRRIDELEQLLVKGTKCYED